MRTTIFMAVVVFTRAYAPYDARSGVEKGFIVSILFLSFIFSLVQDIKEINE